MDHEFDIEPDAHERLNYFNYFTEVEEEFVRRRGSHMLISPLDWALVESWKDAGIPVTVVIRGINRAFDGYDSRGLKFSKVNSIIYCQQAVEESFAEYRLARVGEGKPSDSPTDPGAVAREEKGRGTRKAEIAQESFTPEILAEFVERCTADLVASREYLASATDRPVLPAVDAIDEALQRSISRLGEIRQNILSALRLDVEAIEADLNSVDRMLLETLRIGCGPELLDSFLKEAKAELRAYKSKMDKAIYEQTLENFVARRLRELGRLPRLSLFYML